MQSSKARTAGTTDSQRGIQSVETGFPLLAALVEAAQPLTLRDLSARAGMTSAKAHPYLVSFIRVGLVQQDAATGRYELGPFALQMGLVGLQRSHPVRTALPFVDALADEVGHTLGIAVLGSHGPTMVHIREARYPVHVNMRSGTVMSMLHTATGRVFVAWLEPGVAQHYIDREHDDENVLASIDPPVRTQEEIARIAHEVRTAGIARALGNPLPGIDALSVPVFDHSGRLAMALTCLGPASLFDADPDGRIAQPLRACAARISQQLGYRRGE
ncbi:IclR family transcriptional regulator domain-containing protein [Yanghanlia caeni]|uniref:IclR family transcriptional regulator n=1 Tax=Yanghanlia caeni TaxID=3064283 RepID=A0ABU1D936_9BURK|nr:IclR family transcriptional regulator [Alcaligenaceae bacterium LG-2]NGR08187.1 IclR family transcriptional regulator [bacterium SGD-2]HZH55984.1 IclR family transcriptional regulator [Burkholderiaceae bacterium]